MGVASRFIQQDKVKNRYVFHFSRIANALVPRDHHDLHAESTNDVGCKSKPTIPHSGTPFLKTTESLSREDNFGYQSKTENHSREDLFEAMLELCKYTRISRKLYSGKPLQAEKNQTCSAVQSSLDCLSADNFK